MASSESSSSNDKLSWGDRRFVKKAAEGGHSEVALGQLAQEKGSNPDVKSYGQQLVQDHTQANSQLMQIAQQKDLKLDEDKSKDDREYKRLSKATGSDFDRQFVEHEVKDHEKDIKEFEKAAKDSKDPQVRDFAAQVLPKLREHLAMAQRLQQSIVPTGRTGANSWRSDSGGTSSSDASSNSSSTGSSSTGLSTGSSASMNSSTSSSDASSGAGAGASSSSTSSTR
jgi:putative membrane protein